jgi:signal peptidase I
MNLIHTTEGTHYRRWVNIIPSLILPGSAQFLSGRRWAGGMWFLLNLLLAGALLGLLVHPKSPYSILAMGPLKAVALLFQLLVAIESLRCPIPRVGLRGWAGLLGIALGLPLTFALGARTFLVHPFSIPTGAMQPTLMGNHKDAHGNPILGDRIFVDKLTYRFSEPHRGDVVVFRTRGIKGISQGEYYVKRVAGLPGETIGIDPPYLLANEKRVTEPAIFRAIADQKNGFAGFRPASSGPSLPIPLSSPSDRLVLGRDEYLVLGDNSPNSLDGRYFGPIKRASIIGKAVYIYSPAERKRWIE